jgi:saccharopine dehydrogenase-like NADP-dependent oxidoreductase
MKAVIYGVGRMGQVIGYAMDKFGYDIMGVDVHRDGIDNLRDLVGKDISFSLNPAEFDSVLHYEPDVIISSLPYHKTEAVAKWCIDNNMRYCDLGGRVDVSASINEWGRQRATKPIFTDLGLAPGWVNILAEQGSKEIHREVKEVEMMVGGIPGIPSNPPLNYAVTWSTDGLINEYIDDCEVLYQGEIKSVPGMDGLETVHIDLIDEDMEAFFTSGGASHTLESMKARGVENCFYKTIRWPGHCEAIKFLIKTCDLSEECLMEVFKKGCADNGGDIVLIRALVKSDEVSWKKEKIIPCDPATGFSAMQRSTAFPISSIAKIMAEGYFDNRVTQNRVGETKLPIVLNYSDIPFDEFNKNLETLGI